MTRLDKIEAQMNNLIDIVHAMKEREIRKEVDYYIKPEPKFKVGDWVIYKHLNKTSDWDYISGMRQFDEQRFRIKQFDSYNYWLIVEGCNRKFNPDWCEKWIPKKGEYVVNGDGIMIYSHHEDGAWLFLALLLTSNNEFIYISDKDFKISNTTFNIRPATPAEIASLDNKLAEQGKRFDKEKGEIVEIEKRNCRTCFNGNTHIQNRDYCIGCTPTYKEGAIYNNWKPITQPKPPIIGELAIFWNNRKTEAIITILKAISEYDQYRESKFMTIYGGHYNNAILYESPKQYKQFIKS